MPIVAHNMYIITATKKGTPHKHALCALEYVLYTFWIAHEHA